MKIISSFHDYYDTVMLYGQDSNTVFKRDQFVFEKDILKYGIISKLKQDLIEHDTFRYYIFEGTYNVNTVINNKLVNVQYNVNKFKLVFCGKVYPGIKVEAYAPNYINNIKTECFYNQEEFYDFIGKSKIDLLKYKSTKEEVNEVFKPIKLAQDYLIENKISIAVLYDNIVTINPKLKEYNFVKIMDPYVTFQTLMNWVDGVLTYPPNFMVEIEDKYKISSHGFDPKYGFRKRPNHVKN